VFCVGFGLKSPLLTFWLFGSKVISRWDWFLGVCLINKLNEGDRGMLEQLKYVIREFVNDEELFDLMAQAMKKMYTALIKAGFSAEEATRIIAGQGMGVKTSRHAPRRQ